MCVAFLFLAGDDTGPTVPRVVLCVNRDEAYSRPTLASHWWEDSSEIFAGRDERAGGTWLGVTKTGRVAVLTNFAESIEVEAASTNFQVLPSRGGLVSDFLSSTNTDGPMQYLEKLKEQRNEFAGFNLIVGDTTTGEFAYLGNRGDVRAANPKRLDAHSPKEGIGMGKQSYGLIYAVSNATLDVPWPKVELGKERLRCAMETFNANGTTGDFANRLIHEVLENRGLATEETGEQKSGTKSALPLRDNPSAFVKPGACPHRPIYGTRCSTVITATAREVTVLEKSMRWSDGKGQWQEPVSTKFRIEQ